MSATGNHHIVDGNPWEVYTITVDSLRDRNATVASVRFHTNNTFNPYITATGSSKREPGDPQNDTAGEELAIGRALISLGQYLVRNAESVYAD